MQDRPIGRHGQDVLRKLYVIGSMPSRDLINALDDNKRWTRKKVASQIQRLQSIGYIDTTGSRGVRAKPHLYLTNQGKALAEELINPGRTQRQQT